MTVLVDTHAFIWAAGSERRLSPKARAVLEDGRNQILVSTATIWEIAVNHALGREDFYFPEESVLRAVESLRCQVLAVEARHALALFRLPAIHRDPFDRMLVAQAWADNLLLLTADTQVASYPQVQTIW